MICFLGSFTWQMNVLLIFLVKSVNKQNFKYRGTENPSNKIVDESPRSELKMTVWMAICCMVSLGPTFFRMKMAGQLL